jgi:2-keto-4-pentenoate hydratase/2-oxohepta-3-ene-1,7-dioic acid hydratase in catechol pathway
MMVGIFELMAYISTHFTLQPGDVVLTGTPAGVASAGVRRRIDAQPGRPRFHVARVA